LAKKYKTGDIVQLKSGGPKMTVKEYALPFTTDVVKTGHLEIVICQWFAGSKHEQAGFPVDSLQTPDPDKKS
jgi:uncharacterized protein YodC (DUF2158 family)